MNPNCGRRRQNDGRLITLLAVSEYVSHTDIIMPCQQSTQSQRTTAIHVDDDNIQYRECIKLTLVNKFR